MPKRSCPGARGASTCFPDGREGDGPLEVRPSSVRGRADVEAHCDVGAEPALDLRDLCGREARLGAVVDGAEGDALLVEREDRVPERKYLEATRIREDRPVPARERVDAAELGDDVLSRPEMQVVRVAEDHMRADRTYLVRMQRLDGGFRSDGHERGRRDVTVGGSKKAGARGAVRGRDRERAQRGPLETSASPGPPRASTRVERTEKTLTRGARECVRTPRTPT
jgi:hypothetical protein